MTEDTMQILKMIEEGKITAEEGKKLIEALGNDVGTEAIAKAASPKKKKNMLRVVVDSKDEHGEKTKVRVNLPLDAARKLAGLTTLIPKSARNEMAENGIDIDSIDLPGLIDMFLSGEMDENLVDIESGDSGKGANVKVYVD
ncbi:MAG: hypothetical protein Q8865_04370 [Bacillota bacterium]|nr:hypothetical protein [Bacillota bacterium]